ncbi:MAG: hypothetical protein JRF57_06845 [Deltaproteobacteria bacterium]|nr:hypothetical protein [Deltaproteobacteria bacterium]
MQGRHGPAFFLMIPRLDSVRPGFKRKTSFLDSSAFLSPPKKYPFDQFLPSNPGPSFLGKNQNPDLDNSEKVLIFFPNFLVQLYQHVTVLGGFSGIPWREHKQVVTTPKIRQQYTAKEEFEHEIEAIE